MTGGYRATETIKLTMELIPIPQPLRTTPMLTDLSF